MNVSVVAHLRLARFQYTRVPITDDKVVRLLHIYCNDDKLYFLKNAQEFYSEIRSQTSAYASTEARKRYPTASVSQ